MESKFYEVTMRVEVTRRVLATSEEEAHEKGDIGDMVHESKNYGLDEEIIIRKLSEPEPTVHDIIEDIGEQIVQNSHGPMYMLREKYDEIRKLNKKLAKAGKETHEPYVFNRMTDGFLEALRK